MGVDMLSIDGFECAGHPGEEDIGGLVLVSPFSEVQVLNWELDSLTCFFVACSGDLRERNSQHAILHRRFDLVELNSIVRTSLPKIH